MVFSLRGRRSRHVIFFNIWLAAMPIETGD
jgi:hypothetical protein